MYDHIEGELIFKSPTQAVIAAGGVGYRFSIPISTFAALPERGRAKLLTYLHVREDVLKLFGFASEKERKLFVRLIGVSGIGPGTAMAILNGLSVDEFRRAVAAEEVSTLCGVKGIGRKTAERVIVELRREMERELLEEPATRGAAGNLNADALAAMLALGYTRSVSEAAVLKAMEKLGRDANLEQLVRQALRQV
ncbi:MAG: Holliday junction branch migration protein RuvA [Candidatus Brocadiia bacterium]|jgi:Holliday junction DNA helicase RuvA